MQLTIAIPTYNRPDKLLSTLKTLIAESPAEVRLLVVDNASDQPVEDFVRERLAEVPERVRFHRNRANVGLVANICRCYELVETPWVWTVGDDDAPVEGAIPRILEEIERLNNEPKVLGINFSTSLYTYPESRILHNLEEYWEVYQEPMAFSNALFLASCVFRIENVLKFLRVGYQQAFSAASHISIPIAGLSNGMRMAIANPLIMKIVSPTNEDGWNWVSVYSGIPVLAEMPNDAVTVRGISRPLGLFAPGMRIKNGIKLIFSDESRHPSFWYIYYSRLVPCLRGRKAVLALTYRFIAGLMFRNPPLRKLCVGLLHVSGFPPANTVKGNERL
jgi:glycosyltransferase involved in cell wall biosynthesis